MSSVQCIMISSAELISEFIPGMFMSKFIYESMYDFMYEKSSVQPFRCAACSGFGEIIWEFTSLPQIHVCCAIYAITCT